MLLRMNINITQIWMSQRTLRRAGQIPAMIEALQQGDTLPPVVLSICEDDEIQLEDGHHRLAAIWLSGKKILHSHEYILRERTRWRTRCGKIERLTEVMKSGYFT